MKLRLTLEFADTNEKIVEIEIPIPPGSSRAEVMDTLQRAACNAFEVLAKISSDSSDKACIP